MYDILFTRPKLRTKNPKAYHKETDLSQALQFSKNRSFVEDPEILINYSAFEISGLNHANLSWKLQYYTFDKPEV